MPWLSGEYYSQCNAIFRGATDQGELMLQRVMAHCSEERPAGILSVGAGTGLFEVPLLERLAEAGLGVQRFVGIDPNRHACAQLERKLAARLEGRLAWQVLPVPFQAFHAPLGFDLLLFNHAFEYLGPDPVRWVGRTLELLSPGGAALIFSPNRGGINQVYSAGRMGPQQHHPIFSEELEAALREQRIPYRKELIEGRCDVSLLLRGPGDPQALGLLSFLTQRDCRQEPGNHRQEWSDYFLSLREQRDDTIPHPTSLFILSTPPHGEIHTA